MEEVIRRIRVKLPRLPSVVTGVKGVTSVTSMTIYVDSILNANKNRGGKVGTNPVNEVPLSYATRLSHMSFTKANLQKLEANVQQDANYDLWLPFASVHEVKFHDVPLVAYISDELSLMATKIGTPMMLDSYTNFMCLESWGWSTYARTLIEINACNNFSDNLVMAVPDLEGNGYTKQKIHVEYVWKPHCCNTCLIFGHSRIDCPKAPPKRVVNSLENGKEQSSKADDEGYIEVKNKKSGGINEGNGTFSLSNSFKALNIDLVIEEVEMGNKASTFGMKEEGYTLIVERINGSEDEVKSVDNEMASYLALKPSGVGYGTKILLEQ
ncbi:hypothetical protein Tco_1032300 [Tanacetum coccineum]|uniref:DUF4283 domain-containing protein n=1 Tax=Tanacetum coccineum TaxID=301880 RepID=A0ABQ5GBN7_9ASTR